MLKGKQRVSSLDISEVLKKGKISQNLQETSTPGKEWLRNLKDTPFTIPFL